MANDTNIIMIIIIVISFLYSSFFLLSLSSTLSSFSPFPYWDMVSLCSSDWSGTHDVDQVSLWLTRDPLAPASSELRLKGYLFAFFSLFNGEDRTHGLTHTEQALNHWVCPGPCSAFVKMCPNYTFMICLLLWLLCEKPLNEFVISVPLTKHLTVFVTSPHYMIRL